MLTFFAHDVIFLLMYYGLLALLAVIFISIIRIEYRSQNIAILFWFALSVVYMIPAVFDPFVEDASLPTSPYSMRLINNPTLLRAVLFALGFSTIYLVVRMLSYSKEVAINSKYPLRHLPEVLKDEKLLNTLLGLIVGVAILSCSMAITAIITTSGLSGLTEATYASYRLESNQFLKMGSYYLIISIGSGVFISWYTGRWSICGILVLCTATVFLLGRTRQLLLPTAIPFIMYFMYFFTGIWGRIKLFLGIVVLYLFLLFLQIFRYQGGLLAGFEGMSDPAFYASFLQAVIEFKGEMLSRYGFYFFIREDVSYTEFLTGQTYRRLLLMPVPTDLSLGLKPRLFDEVLYDIIYNYPPDVHGTFHALVFGNTYGNFGWYGMVVGGVWAVIAHGMNMLISSRTMLFKVLLWPSLGFGAAMMARGSIYNSITVVFCAIILGYLFYGCASLFSWVSQIESSALLNRQEIRKKT